MGYDRWDDLKNLDVGSGSCIQDYAFLYGITQLISPKIIVEIGTNFGVSSIAMALAMIESDAPTGHIYTFDLVDHSEIVIKQFEKMGVQNVITYFPGKTSNNIKDLKLNHIDMCFIDGDHTYEGALKDYNNLKHLCDYMVFHDIHCNSESRRQFHDIPKHKVPITNRPGGHVWYESKLDRQVTDASFGGFGICKGEYKKSKRVIGISKKENKNE